MAFDAHKNLAYSTVLTAPSPAISGTSLVVQSGDGAKFPTPPFNATIWPTGARPIASNSEVVRVTGVSTDTLTIVRAKEGTSARSVIIGDQIAATITAKTFTDIEGGLLGSFDYVISGCVWTADAVGSTKAASMTAGSIWLGGTQLAVAAVTSRTFTASKDGYVDFSDNGDGTAAITYIDNTTNAASPALAAGSLRNAIVVVGATNIATTASINQGQNDRVLPIASSIPYTVTDSIGNLICSRDPTSKLLGYRQITSTLSGLGTTSATALTGLSVTFLPVPNRRYVVKMGGTDWQSAGAMFLDQWIFDTNTSGTVLAHNAFTPTAANGFIAFMAESVPVTAASASAKTVIAAYAVSTSTTSLRAATSTAWIKVELL